MQWRTRIPKRAPRVAEGPAPRDLLDRLDRLHRCLVTARDFSVPFEHFDTHVASSPDLFAYSDPRRHDLLHQFIEQGTTQILPTFELRERTMFEVRHAGFWHGLGFGRRCQLFFFYFDRHDKGLVAINDPLAARGVTHFLRINRIVRPERSTPEPPN